MTIIFSWRAFVIFILAMIPNIIYFKNPPTDLPAELERGKRLVETIENISRMISIILLMFLSKNPNASLRSPWTVGMVVFLSLYFVLWGRYFWGGRSYSLLGKRFMGIPAPMAIFPVCYFICAAFWLDCVPAVVTLIIFGISHVAAFR